MGTGFFMMGWMWIIPLLFLIILFGTIYFLARSSTPPNPSVHSTLPGRTHESQESALEILKKRYARGEISREEFEQMKKDLMENS